MASFTRPPIIMVQWKWVYLQYDRFLSIFWVIFHEKPMIMGDFGYVGDFTQGPWNGTLTPVLED